MNDIPLRASVRPKQLLAAALTVSSALIVPLHFYDQFSWLPDDGAYAYVASRILSGAVLNLDIQDVHAGYINFFNAAAMKVFGPTLLSLRWPLVGITALQSIVIFWMLRRQHLVVATLGGVAFSSLTFVQFLNPTANWYCLFFVVAILAVLTWLSPASRSRLFLIGGLLGLTFLTRQLSGVFVGIGTVVYLLHEANTSGTHTLPARLTMGLVLAATAAYVWRSAGPAVFILIGIWPILVGCSVVWKAQVSGRKLFEILSQLTIGALVAAIPLVVYHLSNQSLGTFFDDVVFAAISLSEQDFIDTMSYIPLLHQAIGHVFAPAGIAEFLNGIFWLTLVLSPIALGGVTLYQIWRREGPDARRQIPPIAILAGFYALVGVHYQIPIYLFYASALVSTALLVASLRWTPPYRWVLIALTAATLCIGLFFQAGQPLSRGISGTVSGKRVDMPTLCTIEKLDLRLEDRACQTHRQLLAIIAEHTSHNETIFALPVNPELYFLSGRNPPVRFFSTTFGIRNNAQLERALMQIGRNPPKLVIHSPKDKYNTIYTRGIVDWVAGNHYRLLESFDGFDIYERVNQSDGGAASQP